MAVVLDLPDVDSTCHLLLRAGIESICDRGVDRLTASQVIARAGVSRPTFYSYFGDVTELLAEIWLYCGAQWLDALTSPDADSSVLDTSMHVALTELVIIAPRTPEVLEVMKPDIISLIDKISSNGDAAFARQIWNIGLLMGLQTAFSVLPDVKGIMPLLPVVAEMPDSWSGRSGRQKNLVIPLPPVSEPRFSEDDSVSDLLLRASVDVVAVGGVERASLQRICRVARLTTGAAKPRFTSNTELLLKGFDHMMDAVVNQNIGQFKSMLSQVKPWDSFAAYTVAGLDSSRSRWRRYRQEMFLAARHDVDLANHMRESFDKANSGLLEKSNEFAINAEGALVAIMFNSALALGFGILADVGVPVREAKHQLVTDWINERTPYKDS